MRYFMKRRNRKKQNSNKLFEKIFLIIFIIIWIIYIPKGIRMNCSHYSIIDWVIVICLFSFPFIILIYLFYKKHKKTIINIFNIIPTHKQEKSSIKRSEEEPLAQATLTSFSIEENIDFNKLDISLDNTIESKLDQTEQKETIIGLTNKERFFLHYLRNRKMDWHIDAPVKDLFPNYKETISNLKENGYLTRDNHSYFLETMTIPELKNILKSLALPVSGKKAELTQRIIQNTSESQRKEICPDLYYVLTEKGILEEESYFSEHKKQNLQLKENILSLIKKGDFREAVYCMCESYAKEIIAPGIGIDWNDKEAIWNTKQKKLVKLQKYNFPDLDNSESFKQLLIKCLFYKILIEHELWKAIALFIDETNEILSCKSLSLFFEQYNYTPTESQKWYTYLSTKLFNIYQDNMHQVLKNESYEALPDGIYNISETTIELWKEYQKYELLSQQNIDGFPTTYETYKKHKANNSKKYQFWISQIKDKSYK